MTIHHDKYAYGKIESLDEEISPEELKKMVSDVNESSKDGQEGADETDGSKGEKGGE